jgi:hypothetical protein
MPHVKVFAKVKGDYERKSKSFIDSINLYSWFFLLPFRSLRFILVFTTTHTKKNTKENTGIQPIFLH